MLGYGRYGKIDEEIPQTGVESPGLAGTGNCGLGVVAVLYTLHPVYHRFIYGTHFLCYKIRINFYMCVIKQTRRGNLIGSRPPHF